MYTICSQNIKIKKKWAIITFMGPILTFIIVLSIILKNATHSDPFNVIKSVEKPRKLIIDTDAGADDALAILLALKYEAAHQKNIEIIAITCTYGNTEVKNVETNVLKILSVANRSNIPVYGGAELPLIKQWEDTHYFGKDGLGDFNFEEEIKFSVNRSKLASIALIDLVKANPGEVSIIALGPLTNIALAIRLDRTFISLVKELHIVGSSVYGTGNISPNVEFNIGTDPESSFIVFNSTTKPIILMPWEIVTESPILKAWRTDLFGKVKSKAVEFLNKAEKIFLTKTDSWTAIDGRIIAAFCWPNLILKSLLSNVTPVFDGAAQGSVLVDYINITGKAQNARIVQAFDVELYQKKLVQYFAD